MVRNVFCALAIAGAAWAQSYTGEQPSTPYGGGESYASGESTFLAEEDDTGFLGLEGLDLRVRSENELFEMAFSGRVDLTFYGLPGDAPGLLGHDHPFVSDRADLFIDTWIGDVVYIFVDGRTDRGENSSDDSQVARMEQYFIRFSYPGDFDLSVQFGKFPGPIGNFIPRHDTSNDNLLRPPIVYDQPTHLGWKRPAPSNAALIARRDRPHHWNQGVTHIWQAYYASGGAMFGSWKFLNWRFGAMNTAPGDLPESWALSVGDHHDKFNFMGRLGAVPLFGLEVGLNVSRGPYLDRDAEDRLGGKSRSDFDQILYGIDAQYSMGDVDLYFETYRSEWEAHNIDGDLVSWAWYLEGKYTFVPGFFGAARFGRITYNAIRDADGEKKTWDRDYDRIEIGAGYWLKKNLLMRAGMEWNVTEADEDPDDDAYMLGLTLTF